MLFRIRASRIDRSWCSIALEPSGVGSDVSPLSASKQRFPSARRIPFPTFARWSGEPPSCAGSSASLCRHALQSLVRRQATVRGRGRDLPGARDGRPMDGGRQRDRVRQLCVWPGQVGEFARQPTIRGAAGVVAERHVRNTRSSHNPASAACVVVVMRHEQQPCNTAQLELSARNARA